MKRFISLLMCVLMVTALFPFSVSAEENVGISYTPVPDFYESDELFAAYVEREFYPEYAISTFGTAARAELNSYGKKLYDALKDQIALVAKGSASQAYLEIPKSTLSSWGVSTTYSKSSYTLDTATAAAFEKLQYDLVLDALLHDCPYELYWFDKTTGFGRGYSTSSSSSTITLNSLTFSLAVVGTYKGSGYNPNMPTANTSKTSATSTAVNNANAIINKYKSLGDYEKIVAYKEEICDLVSYNDDAAEGKVDYGDPWQMIYVFDNNSSTNVVCEGYSKAFQYLCDKSSFNDSDVACYSVSGTTQYDGTAGGHMWNIVTMPDGKNYMADITNSDSGAIGQNGGLFLEGVSGSISNYYYVTFQKKMYYTYSDDEKSFWGTGTSSILRLSSTDYPVPQEPVHSCTPDGNGWYCDELVHSHYCECGEEIDVGSHYGEWKEVTPAQVGVEGLREKRCDVCNYLMDSETIPALEDNTTNDDDEVEVKPADPIVPTPTPTPDPDEGGTDDGNTGDGNTDDGNTDSGNTDSGNTDDGNADSGNTDDKDETNPTPDAGDKENNDNEQKTVGDINGNDKLDARDYLLLKRAFFGTFTLKCDLSVADINGNGKLDARDYLLLKRAFFGTYVIK